MNAQPRASGTSALWTFMFCTSCTSSSWCWDAARGDTEVPRRSEVTESGCWQHLLPRWRLLCRGGQRLLCRGGQPGGTRAARWARTAQEPGDTRLSRHREPQVMRLAVIQPAELSAPACGGDKSPREASTSHQNLIRLFAKAVHTHRT